MIETNIKKLRICILTSARILEVKYGGEGRFAFSLGNWLARQNHDAILMGSGFASIKTKHLSDKTLKQENKKTTNVEQKKVMVLYPPYPVYLLSRLIMSLLWVFKIVAINIKSPISIIHAQDTGYSGLAAIVSGRILRIPVIVSSHGIRHKSLESTIKGRLKTILLKMEYHLDIFTVKNADGVIVDNPSIKNYFEEAVSRRIDFIPIPIKTRDFQFSDRNRYEIRKELGIDEKTVVVGFVGRFSPEKNIIALLDSFANVVKLQDSCYLKLILIGTGPLESQLKEYSSKRSIVNKVEFCGVRHDISKILSSIDIFVLPSYTEGLSAALLEAMACGRAIICSDIPANRELVQNNKEGVLIDPYNSKELEHAIHALSSDTLLRSKLGDNARIKAAHYDDDVLFPKVERYYRTMVEERTMSEENTSVLSI